MTQIGYEKEVWRHDHLPPEYWAFRIIAGRYQKRGGPYASEKEADAWIERHRGFDEDDKARARVK